MLLSRHFPQISIAVLAFAWLALSATPSLGTSEDSGVQRIPWNKNILQGSTSLEPASGEALVADFTSPDSGFFASIARHEGTGEMWAGSYGGRIFVKRGGIWQLHSNFSSIAESVYRMVYHPGTNTLYATFEMLSKVPCIYRLDGDTWVSTGYGHQYSETAKAMGFGLGVGADGYIYAASSPYVTNYYVNSWGSYVWRSADGINWSSFTETPSGHFGTNWVAFQGETYGSTSRFSAGHLLRLNGTNWDSVWTGDKALWYLKEFKGNLYAAGEESTTGSGVVCRWNGTSFEKVFGAAAGGSAKSFCTQMGVAKDEMGTEWLYVTWTVTWRATSGSSRVYRTSDGTNWSLFQSFSEGECWGCARGEDEYTLYVGTRQEGGHGKIYVYRADVEPPSIPTNVQAAAQSPNSIRVTWTASTDNAVVAGYRIYRNGSEVGTSDTTSYDDTGLQSNVTYLYTVSAYDVVSNSSAQSSPPAIATTLDGIAPSVPSDVQATVQTPKQVKIIWTASTDNVGVSGYKVYRNGVEIANSTGTDFTDSKASPDTAYSYTVTAYDAAGNESDQSVPAHVTTMAAIDIAAAKRLADSTTVGLLDKTVTAVFDDCIYLLEPDRHIGVKVIPSQMPPGLSIGSYVDVGGIITTDQNDQRVIRGFVEAN